MDKDVCAQLGAEAGLLIKAAIPGIPQVGNYLFKNLAPKLMGGLGRGARAVGGAVSGGVGRAAQAAGGAVGGAVRAPIAAAARRPITAATAIGAPAAYMGARQVVQPTIHSDVFGDATEGFNTVRQKQLADIQAAEAGTDTWGATSPAQRKERVARLNAQLESGEYGGNTTATQYKARAQAAADAMRGGQQQSGGWQRMFGGFRDQGAAEEYAKSRVGKLNLKDIGIPDPTAPLPPSAAKVKSPLDNQALEFANAYGNAHNAYTPKNWQNLEAPQYLSPAIAQTGR